MLREWLSDLWSRVRGQPNPDYSRLMRMAEFAGQARVKDPAGCKCFFCGRDNFFADELGFFYITSGTSTEARGGRPCCKSCFLSDPGRRHKQRLTAELLAHTPIEVLRAAMKQVK